MLVVAEIQIIERKAELLAEQIRLVMVTLERIKGV